MHFKSGNCTSPILLLLYESDDLSMGIKQSFLNSRLNCPHIATIISVVMEQSERTMGRTQSQEGKWNLWIKGPTVIL